MAEPPGGSIPGPGEARDGGSVVADEATEGAGPAVPVKASGSASHLRGSALLLGGRVMALAVDFAGHVLVVRYLAKETFGAYSFALGLATLLYTAMLLGLPDTLARYVPIYRERGEAGKVVGAAVASAATVAVAGAAWVAFVALFPELTARLLGSAQTGALLGILIFVVPLEAVNAVLQALFAAVGRVRAIFLRQYVLVPGLRFAVVALLVGAGYSVTFLAAGYVLTSVVGLLFYASGLLRRGRSVRDRVRSRIEVPVRELVTFALPVFVSALLMLTLFGLGTIVLGLMQGPAEVAEFQVVERPARLNLLIYSVFAVLYVPTAAGLYARGDLSGLRHAYNASTLWMLVLGLPGLLLTTVFAPVFVPAVFGERYASSAVVLILLSAAYFSFVGAGPNGPTLKVFRRLRATIVIDVSTLALGFVLIVALVPMAGATGAALGTLGAVLTRNVMLRLVLRRVMGGSVLGAEYLRLALGVAAILGALSGLQLVVDVNLVVAILLSGAAGLGVLFAARRVLDVGGTFPELQRLPLPGFLRP